MTARASWSLRIAGPSDAEAITHLLSSCYPRLLAGAYPQPVLDQALPLMTRAHPDLMASGTYYVAQTESGDLVGCGGWTFTTPGTGEIAEGVAHIRHVGTDPDSLRQGIGRGIVLRSLADAKTEGARKVSCFSTLNAEAFYAACGFIVVRRFDVELAQGVPFAAVEMMLDVA
jgi:N-acetylglutamate synthase-like GNAT family acetyltransferase